MSSRGGLSQNSALTATVSKTLHLFQFGCVQKKEVTKVDDTASYRSRCQPGIRTIADCNIATSMNIEGGKREVVVFLFVSRTCPAGKGPTGSCKHIAALKPRPPHLGVLATH